MQKRKTHSLTQTFSNFARQVLLAAGAPPLFFAKILLWTIVWFAREGVKLVKNSYFLLSGIAGAAEWFGELPLKFPYRDIVKWTKIRVRLTRKNLKKQSLALTQNLAIRYRKMTGSWTVFEKPKKTDRFSRINKQIGVWLNKLTAGYRNFLGQASARRDFILNLRKRRTRPVPLPPSEKEIYRFSRPPSKLKYLLVLLLGFVICFLTMFIPYWTYSAVKALPDPHLLSVRDIPVSTKIYDRNGILLYQVYSDENRTIVNLDDLPPYIAQATIAIEDKNFYHHPGFDIGGIARAAFADATGEPIQGGSTITQQLVKSALLSPQQTLARKIKELALAFWTEKIYSKKDILSMYLNQIAYGGAAYGIEEASQTYFGKPAKNLTLGEAALLAGLPSAPSVYSPFGSHPELARERQAQVLNAMVDQGYISAYQAKDAEEEQLKFNSLGTSIKAPHFVMYVKDYLTRKYGSRLVEKGGLEVTTSLDYHLYEAVNKILKDGIDRQKYLNVGNGAVLITDPATGEILTMIGSTDFFDLARDGNVNVTLAPRSPGSSIKPLNYALGMEMGWLTPATVLDDAPVVYHSPGGPDYVPQNYDNRFHGKVTARVALGSSFNIPALKVLDRNGVGNFIQFARKMGITTWNDTGRYGLALTLGGGDVTMTDMSVAYSTFADNGVGHGLKPVLLVKDYKGEILEDDRDPDITSRGQVISPQTAFLISNILADDSARAPTFGPGSYLNIGGRTVSVKTGTTQDKRDNWTIGYTPSYLTAVWVGNNNNSPMSPYLESGNTGAAAVWNPVMTYLLRDKPDEPIREPGDIVGVAVCAINGLLPCDGCPATKIEYFKKGSEPKTACQINKDNQGKPTDNSH